MTLVVPQAPEKRFRHRNPARPVKKHSARSLLFLQSLRRLVNLPSDGIILNLDIAVGKAAPRVPHVSRLSRRGIPCSGVIRIVLAISIISSSPSDTGVPRRNDLLQPSPKFEDDHSGGHDFSSRRKRQKKIQAPNGAAPADQN
jgi:hypothetical protein